MRYVVEYNTSAEARSASAAEATKRGCGKNPDDVTRYWYSVHEHPTNKRGAVEVEDDHPAPSGKGKKTRAELKAGGWFPDVAL